MTVTTIGQSKRLLDAGVNSATADMSYIRNPRDGGLIISHTKPMTSLDIPCWSMGALWEMCRERSLWAEFTTGEDVEMIISEMVNMICESIKKE